MNNTCVCCGAMIPEGCQVCKACEKGFTEQNDAEKKILEHYGNQKQELQAVQELTELILLLAARQDQRGDNYAQNIMSELADVQIMCEQIQLMNGISDREIDDMKSFKLRRQLARIESEVQKNATD